MDEELKKYLNMKILAVSLLLFLSSCLLKKTNKEEIVELAREEVEIVIEVAQSFTYDLKKEIYTVYSIERNPVEVKFSLSDQEREAIFKKYQVLNFNRDSKEINVSDDCFDMPKLYTIVWIKSKSGYQKLKIDRGCSRYNGSYAQQANQLREFITLVTGIIRSKPEVRNALKSDILYY